MAPSKARPESNKRCVKKRPVKYVNGIRVDDKNAAHTFRRVIVEHIYPKMARKENRVKEIKNTKFVVYWHPLNKGEVNGVKSSADLEIDDLVEELEELCNQLAEAKEFLEEHEKYWNERNTDRNPPSGGAGGGLGGGAGIAV